MFDSGSIETMLEGIGRQQGFPPLSEAKLDRIARREGVTFVAEGDDLVAVGVTATHVQGDGSVHWAVETAVTPSLQFAAFETSVLTATLASVPRGVPVSVWASRSSLATALDALGFVPSRRLAYMVVDLPLPESVMSSVPAEGVSIGTATESEQAQIVRINNEAFAGHREADAMTADEFVRITREPWFDPEGIVMARTTESAQPVGFCWTKVHPNGDGEIFRIAVEPDQHGRGLGRALLVAGFASLSGRQGVRRGSLWVDEANRAAMALYRGIGMVIERENVEYEHAR